MAAMTTVAEMVGRGEPLSTPNTASYFTPEMAREV